MIITVCIDDEVYGQALELASPDIAPVDLVQEALQTFVRVTAAKRLAALGGTMPEMKSAPVYEQDTNAWAYEQARLLRAGRFELLDVGHLAGEIEDVGKSEQRELASRMAVLLAHLLKWAYQSERRGASWVKTIKAQRKEISYVLAESPSLAPKLQEPLWLDVVWSRAVAQAVTETGLDCFPEECPWDLQGEVIRCAWLPAE